MDYDLVSQYTWYAVKQKYTFYAQTILRDGQVIYMHRLIVGPNGPEVDHCNGIGLDNRRENLRPVTRQQNMFNMRPRVRKVTSEYRGVYWSKDRQGWVAQIKLNYKAKRLGTFPIEEDAALTYDDAARQLFGAYARLNFPFGVEHEEF
jgi:HNH endonuclease/AP2 domain